MCQIHIIDRKSYDKDNDKIIKHLDQGDISNDHGCSLLLVNGYGEHTLVRSLDWDLVRNIMGNSDWDLAFIHQRYTTQGEANLMNTHFWQVGDFFYCHNGVLNHQDTYNYEVDSQVIGQHLEQGKVWDAISYCQRESYANVFIINLKTKSFWVTRSQVNSLYTDGNNQYSTEQVTGIIDIPVPQHSVRQHVLDFEEYQKWSADWSYPQDNYLSYYDKVQASMGNHSKSEKVLDNGSSGMVELKKDIEKELDLEELEQKVHQAASDGDVESENYYTVLLNNKRKSINS